MLCHKNRYVSYNPSMQSWRQSLFQIYKILKYKILNRNRLILSVTKPDNQPFVFNQVIMGKILYHPDFIDFAACIQHRP
jgi:hypothetical protein